MSDELEHLDNPKGEPGAGGVEPERTVESEPVPTAVLADTGEAPTE